MPDIKFSVTIPLPGRSICTAIMKHRERCPKGGEGIRLHHPCISVYISVEFFVYYMDKQDYIYRPGAIVPVAP